AIGLRRPPPAATRQDGGCAYAARHPACACRRLFAAMAPERRRSFPLKPNVLGLAQSFNTDRGHAKPLLAEDVAGVDRGAVDHLDPVNRTLPTLQVQWSRALSGPDQIS